MICYDSCYIYISDIHDYDSIYALQVIQRKGIDPTWTVQMISAIHISLDEADMSSTRAR